MKAAAEGLEVEWVEGDAEELPFETGSFDGVLSTFGHMFAPATSEQRTRWHVCAARAARSPSAAGRPRERSATLPGERFVHASAAGLRLAADPLGNGGARSRHVRLRRDGLRVRAPLRDDRMGVDRGLRRLLHGSLRADGDGETDARRALRRAAAEILAIWADKTRPTTGACPSSGVPALRDPSLIGRASISRKAGLKKPRS